MAHAEAIGLRSQLRWGTVVATVAVLVTLYRMALVQHSGITLFVDEAYYWDWSRQPAWGYFSKPPVIAWMIAAGTALWGASVLGVKAAAMLLYPATAWVIFRLGSELFDERTGAWAALVFITAPLAGLLGLVASTDAPLLLCWALASWALWRALQHGGQAAWCAVGLALGVGLLSKYTMAAWLLTALPALWWHRQQRGLVRGASLAAALALLCFTPHLLWNAINGAPTLHHTAKITLGASQPGGWGEALTFALSQFGVLGPVAAVLLLAAAWGHRAGTTSPAVRYLLLLTLPLLAVALLQACITRANMNWAAPAYIGAALLLARIASRRLLLAVVLSNTLLLTMLCHAQDAARLLGRDLPAQADVFARMRGWDAAFGALAPGAAARPGWPLLADDRALRAHAAYAWRELGVRIVALPPRGPARDQYELTTDARTHAGQGVLLLGEGAAPAALAARCASTQALGQAAVIAGAEQRALLVLTACEGWLTRAQEGP